MESEVGEEFFCFSPPLCFVGRISQFWDYVRGKVFSTDLELELFAGLDAFNQLLVQKGALRKWIDAADFEAIQRSVDARHGCFQYERRAWREALRIVLLAVVDLEGQVVGAEESHSGFNLLRSGTDHCAVTADGCNRHAEFRIDIRSLVGKVVRQSRVNLIHQYHAFQHSFPVCFFVLVRCSKYDRVVVGQAWV